MTARAILSNCWRWTPRRKLALAKAIETGAVNRADAQRAFRMSDEEMNTLFARRERWGERGLRQMQCQRLRVNEVNLERI